MTSLNGPRAPQRPGAPPQRPTAGPPRRPPVPPQRPASAAKQDGPNYSTSTTTDIEPAVAATLSYTLGAVTGTLFLVLEKENKFVRFHAAQSIVASLMLVLLAVGISMASRVLAYLPFVGRVGVFFLTTGLALVTFVLWLTLMYRAFSGEKWELPVAGDLAKKMV
jgi:uncharacterized membrane protein